MIVSAVVSQSTAASAAVEGRIVPPGFVRSDAAQRWLDERSDQPWRVE